MQASQQVYEDAQYQSTTPIGPQAPIPPGIHNIELSWDRKKGYMRIVIGGERWWFKEYLGKTADDLANLQNIVRALKNPDMMVNGASLTLDMVQIMENGDIRLLPPTPTPITETCVQAPEKNGKKPEPAKEPVHAS